MANQDRSGTSMPLVSATWLKGETRARRFPDRSPTELTYSFTDWRKPLPKMHVAGEWQDPSPNDEPFVSDIRCQHGLGQPNANRRMAISSGVRQRCAPCVRATFEG